MRNKKGLSAVIVSMMLVLLAIVSVGVVFVVVNNAVERPAEDIRARSQCLGVSVEPLSTSDCHNSTEKCEIYVVRKAGGSKSEVKGVVITFLNGAETIHAINYSGVDLEQLGRHKAVISLTNTPFNKSGGVVVSKVEVVPFVGKNADGERIICDPLTKSKISVTHD